MGPLLDRQAAVHAWVHERIADGLTLGESYHSQWRELTERLAELYAAAGRHADAAALYRQLLVDPLALPSRDRDIVEAREAHARALFACCRALGDAAALERAFEDLKHAVAHDDRQGGVRTPTKLSTATIEALSAARQELRRRVSAASFSADD